MSFQQVVIHLLGMMIFWVLGMIMGFQSGIQVGRERSLQVLVDAARLQRQLHAELAHLNHE